MKTLEQTKKIINGDYYQLNSSGTYQKHPSVDVHYHEQKDQQTITTQQSKKPQQPNPQEQNPTQKQLLKTPFLENMKKIMQKQQVNSVHEQDSPSQYKIKTNTVLNDKRQKNNKMRRSQQHQLNPKKSILKRSLIDCKQENQHTFRQGNTVIKSNIDNRSVRIINDKYKINDEQYKQQKNTYQPSQKIFRRDSFQVDEQQNNLLRSYIPKYPMQNYNSLQIHNSQTARPSRQNYQNNMRSKRQHTEGRQTVTISPNKYRKYRQQYQKNNVDFQLQIYHKMGYLKDKLQYLENQLNESQHRMKKFQLQHQLKMKQQEIIRVQKQNEYLKNNKISNNNQSKVQKINVDLEPLIKFVQSKAYFIISFLVVMMLCVMIGKNNGQCTKS